MERQLTERENVYHQKLEEDGYRSFLKTVAKIEYQKALIMEVLKEGALSVREISEKRASRFTRFPFDCRTWKEPGRWS